MLKPSQLNIAVCATHNPICLALMLLFLATSGLAAPITYTGFTITDGKLGSWEFHRARVYLTFQGDTNTVQFIQPLIDPTDASSGTIDAYVNQTGVASVTIITSERTVHATFSPGQILITLDLGNTADANQDGTHNGGRGVGFSSISSSGNLEPAYPLGLFDGTLHWGLIVNPNIDYAYSVASQELQDLSVDLVSDTAFSGKFVSCVGFPGTCQPPNPLQTDHGALYLYDPYQTASNGNLDAAYFIAQPKVPGAEGNSRLPLPPGRSSGFRHPITYHAYLISDVTLGVHFYSHAQIYLSFDADDSTVRPFSNGPAYGFVNSTGNAHLTIISSGRSVSADFDPGQLYVYFDIGHSSIGFASLAGGYGYPLAITQKSSTDPKTVLVAPSLVSAVSDILGNPADASLYTPAVNRLVTSLTNPTFLTGEASSCIDFDMVNSYCYNLTPLALHTNRGDFSLYQPYTDDEWGDGTSIFSINWGTFWSEIPGHSDTNENGH